MTVLKLLGYADSKPCSFVLDPATPHSYVSAAFLFENSLHAALDSSGQYHARLSILVPSQGGYYISTDLFLKSSVTCGNDIVLGGDWLSSCRIKTAANVILLPSQENLSRLDEGHMWTADGMSLANA